MQTSITLNNDDLVRAINDYIRKHRNVEVRALDFYYYDDEHDQHYVKNVHVNVSVYE